MARKSKQAGGNLPLTHHERTKKFASSEYGTTSRRLAGYSQYQLGDCALSLTRLRPRETILCSPAGFLYHDEAIMDYLLTKMREKNEQQDAFNREQQASALRRLADSDETHQQRTSFEESEQLVKRQKTCDPKQAALEELKHSSYWLADAQPAVANAATPPPPRRPVSPHSQTPIRRKDLWPVELVWDTDDSSKLVCAVSGKTIASQPATAYWLDTTQPGTVVLSLVWDQLIKDSFTCPLTSRKIKHVRALQKSGTSFASSGQQVQAKKYAPTIT